jgi:hypothetical protein
MAFTDLDVKQGGRHFDGYAAVYGQDFDAGAFVETMLPPMLRSAIATVAEPADAVEPQRDAAAVRDHAARARCS